MITVNRLFEDICSFANLHAAWKRAAAGKQADSIGALSEFDTPRRSPGIS